MELTMYTPLLVLVLGFGCDRNDAGASTTRGGDSGSTDSGSTDSGGCVPTEEVCNEVDDDCDGEVDEAPVDGVELFADADGDGYGDDESTSVGCAAVEGWALQGSDCDDADAEVHPDATEVCNNGKDDDCDGGSNGCQLAGEVSADWATIQILPVDGDFFTGDLETSDIDGDGIEDLFVFGGLASRGGYEGVYAFKGPIEHDIYTTEAIADYSYDQRYELGVIRVIGDIDGDGQSEVTVSVLDYHAMAPPYVYDDDYESWTELYRGAPGIHGYRGDAQIEFGLLFTGRFGDASTSVLGTCAEGSGVTGWCGYVDPFASEEVSFAIEADTSSYGERIAGDLDGDGFDELIFEDEDGVDIVWGPLVASEFGQPNVSVRCEGIKEYDELEVRVSGDTSGDGASELLLVTDSSVSHIVYLLSGLRMDGSCDLRTSYATVVSEGSSADFAREVDMVGDLDGDSTEDWVAGADSVEEGRGEALLYLRLEAGTYDFEDAATVRVVGADPEAALGGPAAPAWGDAFALSLGGSSGAAVGIFAFGDGP